MNTDAFGVMVHLRVPTPNPYAAENARHRTGTFQNRRNLQKGKMETKIAELLVEINQLKRENAIFKRQQWEKRTPLISKVMNQCGGTN
jgi:hypothetical protein